MNQPQYFIQGFDEFEQDWLDIGREYSSDKSAFEKLQIFEAEDQYTSYRVVERTAEGKDIPIPKRNYKLKIFTQDHGYHGSIVVIASSLEAARKLMEQQTNYNDAEEIKEYPIEDGFVFCNTGDM